MFHFLFQGFSTIHLGPMEVLLALQHAEFHLGREFMKEEFIHGQVGKHMIPEDFDQQLTVSPIRIINPYLTTGPLVIIELQ